MKGRAIHMLRIAADDALVRETWCGRKSNGGGIGTQLLRFSGAGKSGDFEATEFAPAVTCRKCLRAMASDHGN